MITRYRLAAICGAILGQLLFLSAAQAEDASTVPQFDMSLGHLFSSSSTTVRLDSDTLGTGTSLNFEDDLGFQASDSVWKAAASYRFGKSKTHQLDVAVFSLIRTAHQQIDEEIQFGDQVFGVHADLRSRFGGRIYKANYTYNFVNKPNYQAGASIGAFVADMRASITNLDNEVTEAEEITAPLPTIGLRGAVKVSDRWRLVTGGDIFFIDTKKYSGTLLDLQAGLEYDLSKRFSLGATYNFVDMTVGIDSDTTHLSAEWAVHGVFTYLKIKL